MNYDKLLILLRLEENGDLFAGLQIYSSIYDEDIINVIESLLIRSLEEDYELIKETKG